MFVTYGVSKELQKTYNGDGIKGITQYQFGPGPGAQWGPFGEGSASPTAWEGQTYLHVFGALFKWRLIGQVRVLALLSGAAAPVSAETVSY